MDKNMNALEVSVNELKTSVKLLNETITTRLTALEKTTIKKFW